MHIQELIKRFQALWSVQIYNYDSQASCQKHSMSAINGRRHAFKPTQIPSRTRFILLHRVGINSKVNVKYFIKAGSVCLSRLFFVSVLSCFGMTLQLTQAVPHTDLSQFSTLHIISQDDWQSLESESAKGHPTHGRVPLVLR